MSITFVEVSFWSSVISNVTVAFTFHLRVHKPIPSAIERSKEMKIGLHLHDGSEAGNKRSWDDT
jgi:hypothetical protein